MVMLRIGWWYLLGGFKDEFLLDVNYLKRYNKFIECCPLEQQHSYGLA